MLDDLILHDRTRQLAGTLARQLPQALIVDGAIGTGVMAVATALAQAAGSPPLVVLPKKKVKNEWVVDANEGNVVIDDIRLLYQQTRTSQPGTQVYVFDTGERSMTIGAQNAFLKLLEEPRRGLHFIIATHQPDQLLPTIRSRSQRLTLLPVTAEQTAAVIGQLEVADPTKRARLAFVGQGKPALIKRLAADDAAYDARVAIMSDAKAMIGGNAYDKLVITHKYKDDRAGAITLLDDMNHQLRTVVRSRPDQALVAQIARHLEARQNILSGGNIRLQLAADMLY